MEGWSLRGLVLEGLIVEPAIVVDVGQQRLVLGLQRDTVAEDGGQGDVLYGRMRARAVRQQREREQERLEREYGRTNPETALALARLDRALPLDLPQDLVMTENLIFDPSSKKVGVASTNRSLPLTPAPRKKSSERIAPARSFLKYLGVSGTSHTMMRENASGGMEESRRGDSE
uniref:Uncharacterized protein n=1 Tax=Pristionchus pacificus TaxID=54126 RepID=A0A8R1UUA1_PRIPA